MEIHKMYIKCVITTCKDTEEIKYIRITEGYKIPDMLILNKKVTITLGQCEEKQWHKLLKK